MEILQSDTHEKLYTILLDIQKQMGDLGTATEAKLGKIDTKTDRQSQMLISLNDKVAVANGRTAKNEGQIAALREWRKYILGGFAVVSLIGTFTLTAYIQKVSKEAVREALVNYTEQ